jgi:hypothetical protein
MLSGIPYFGEDTQQLYESILSEHNLNNDLYKIKQYEDLYSLVNSNINNRIIVIVDNKWLTWLSDIEFNYRDKICYIPYYEYDTYEISDKHFRTNNKGHLILKDSTLSIRHNYSYKKYEISIDNVAIKCVNIDTDERFIVTTNKWIAEHTFSIKKLYQLYIESCFTEDDFIINKHAGGYHYIDKSIQKFRNKEKEYREQYGLNTYSKDFKYQHSYRDVRNFKYDEVVLKHGMIDTVELYKIRKLKFESYLFCVMRCKLYCEDDTFNNQLKQLYNGRSMIKYGINIKLIFKNYWVDEYERNTNKTWSTI